MTTDQSAEQQCFLVHRDDGSITMALHDPIATEDPGVEITYDVWRAVFPIH